MRDIEIGKAVHDSYILNTSTLHSASSCAAHTQTDDTQLWHARTGHVPISVLKLFSFSSKTFVNQSYGTCHLSKQVRHSFFASDSVSSNMFDLIHMNLWGYYRVKT